MRAMQCFDENVLESDQVSLCSNYDSKVHCVNFLVARHSTSLLCHSYQSTGAKLGTTVSVCEQCMKVKEKGGGVAKEESHGGNEIDRDDNADDDDVGDEDEDGHSVGIPLPMELPPLFSSLLANKPLGREGVFDDAECSGGFASSVFAWKKVGEITTNLFTRENSSPPSPSLHCTTDDHVGALESGLWVTRRKRFWKIEWYDGFAWPDLANALKSFSSSPISHSTVISLRPLLTLSASRTARPRSGRSPHSIVISLRPPLTLSASRTARPRSPHSTVISLRPPLTLSASHGSVVSASHSRTTTSSRGDDASVSISNAHYASDIESEWVEQDEPGVYITIRQLAWRGACEAVVGSEQGKNTSTIPLIEKIVKQFQGSEQGKNTTPIPTDSHDSRSLGLSSHSRVPTLTVSPLGNW
ncbi:hypothetical protein Syun_014465 [Stephania yunnanensis]|uniref:Uncharacterized protein n=1 Tax=Stephania yunnanensis TaxID=152371 RepID=A0AAP0JLI7_9MAGN